MQNFNHNIGFLRKTLFFSPKIAEKCYYNIDPEPCRFYRIGSWFGWFLKRKPKKVGSEEKSPAKSARSASEKADEAAAGLEDDDLDDDLLLEAESEILTRKEMNRLSRSLPSRLLCCSWCRFHESYNYLLF
jgi:hypothetical protein